MARLLHLSDLHFGRKNIPVQVDALRALVRRESFDAVVVSGDLTQRARHWEFGRARAFLAEVDAVSASLAVPGNHDVTWWRAPLHLGSRRWMYAKWRRYLGRDVDPVLRIPGVTIAGLVTAHGISRHTLTTRLRDLSVIGDVRPPQIERLRAEFAHCAPGERRVVVMHHNPVAGEISRRYGLKHHRDVLAEFGRIGVDVVLCGHDHQEAVHLVEHTGGGIVVATAGTITTMSRGHRPTSVNVVECDATRIAVQARFWDDRQREFIAGPERVFGGAG